MVLDLVSLAMVDATRHAKKLMQFSFILARPRWRTSRFTVIICPCALLLRGKSDASASQNFRGGGELFVII